PGAGVPVPAPAVRRAAPAGRDRPRARRLAAPAGPGRADQRTRRHRAGQDPRPDRTAARRAPARLPADHPPPRDHPRVVRADGRALPGPDRRVRAYRRTDGPARAPVHAGAALRGARGRRGRAAVPDHPARRYPAHRLAAARLPVPPALPAGHRHLPDDGAAGAGGGVRSAGSLPPGRGGSLRSEATPRAIRSADRRTVAGRTWPGLAQPAGPLKWTHDIPKDSVAVTHTADRPWYAWCTPKPHQYQPRLRVNVRLATVRPPGFCAE